MLRLKSHTKTLTAIVLAAFVLVPQASHAAVGIESMTTEDSDLLRPPTLEEIQNIERENNAIGEIGLPIDIRLDAVKEAAISYGARAGLAARTYEIRKQIDGQSRYLDKVYDFGKLLVPAPSGLLIEPPVVSEAENNMLIDFDGQEAAVSDRIYHIINNARIVSGPRNWRGYLEREWGEVEAPPDILRPDGDDEREVWNDYTEKGWEQGVLQANEIFEEDLNLLNADFQGMVRYRMLLSQGMISPPHALQVDRGVTGDGDEMRVGDRAVKITGVPELMTGFDEWRPASR